MSMSRDAGLRRTTRFSAAFAVGIFSLIVVARCSNNDSEVTCSRICVAENCNSVGIRYGKYCGVGWTGCPGEKPCDDLDACCKIHDDCVGKKGVTDIKCHEKFKTCIKKVQKSGKAGFSQQCPYETAVPTMVQDGLLLVQSMATSSTSFISSSTAMAETTSLGFDTVSVT